MGDLFNVPTLPDNFLSRPEDLTALKREVLSKLQQAVAVTGKAVGGGNVSIQGMGGIGKSVLATALVHDDEVRCAYPDGLFWVSLGQEPDLVDLQISLATDLGNVVPRFTKANNGKTELGRLLKGKRCLVVLDDIWDLAHYNVAFDALGDQCQLLITTRDNSIANRLSAFQYSLAELEKTKALELLQQWANVHQLPDVATDVARECGCLPLALAMVGAYLRDKPKRWERVLEKLKTADLEKHKINKQLLPGYQYELFRAIQVSVEALDEVGDLDAEEVQERYFDFAVFPEDMPIPETVLDTFWQPLGLDEDDTEELVDELVDKSLLRRDDQGRLTLHDLQYDYICKRTEDEIATLHQRWLDAYKEKCDQGWASCPQDGYFFGQLTRHLKEAGQLDELRELLFDYDWLRAQLKASGINTLLADYDCLTADKTLKLLQNTLRLSAHVLATKPKQLTERLWGHLRDREQPEIISLLCQGAERQQSIWLQPQQVNLTAPDGPMIRTLEGHSNGVNSVVMSSDGTLALSGSWDKTLKLWDLTTGETLYTLEGHSDSVNSVGMSADGTLALSGSSDKTLKLWDLTTGNTLHTLEGHSDSVNSVGMNADGTLALSGSSDKTLKLWDLTTGNTLHTLEGHSNSVNSVGMSADGTLALSGSSDKTLKLWDLTTGEILRTLEGHSFRVTSVAVSADGTRALSGSSDNMLKLWDLTTGKILRILEVHNEFLGLSVGMSSDGTLALSGSSYKTLKLWDLNTGEMLRTLEGHGAGINAVEMSADRIHALSGSHDRTLKLWDLTTSNTLGTFKGHSARVTYIGLSADGTHALSGSFDNTLKFWDLTTGNTLHTLEGHSYGVNSVAMSANGTHAIFSSSDKTLKLCDLTTGKTLHTLESLNGEVISVAMSVDGTRAISSSFDNTLKLWDLTTGKTLRILDGHNDRVTSLRMSADGTRAISSSFDNTLKLWDLTTGKTLRILDGHNDRAIYVEMSADGTRAIFSSSDNTLKLWDLTTGKTLRILEGHNDEITSLKLNANGTCALSGSQDNVLKLWDLVMGDCRATFCGDYSFYACDLSADGTTIVAGDAAGAVHFFSVIHP